MAYFPQQADWLNKALALVPAIHHQRLEPVSVVELKADPSAFQCVTTTPVGAIDPDRLWSTGDSAVFDFGANVVGRLTFHVADGPTVLDAPVRLKLECGEVSAEIFRSFDDYAGGLCRSWLQDEIVNVDRPGVVELPRRYTLRYLRVTVMATPRRFLLRRLAVRTETSASGLPAAPRINHPREPELRHIFDVGCRTLANCMQNVFEDGPKRDRRLWLGDLRLQALANYHSFADRDLVRRSLYLLAGQPCEDGLLSACVYDQPSPASGHTRLLPYALLLASTVLEFVQAGGDAELAEDLWPLILRQAEIGRRCIGEDGLFDSGPGYWNFVDWKPGLNGQAACHATLIICLRATAEIGRRLGRDADVAGLGEVADRLADAARTRLWDESRGVFVSGPDRQVSYASQAWMTLAGVLDSQRAARAMLAAPADPEAVRPATPYLWHYVTEAMFVAGLCDEAVEILLDYWGGMISRGATTFWEVFDPEQPMLSPYGDPRMNSYCHAWSCGPVYLIGRYLRG